MFDTCGDADVAMKDVFFAVKDALDSQEDRPLLGKTFHPTFPSDLSRKIRSF